MLTRPKLMVPDQKGRTVGSRPSSESPLRRFVLPLGNLLLPSVLHCGKALRQLLLKRTRSATFADLGKPRMLAFCFCLKECREAIAIFITELAGIEFSFQCS